MGDDWPPVVFSMSAPGLARHFEQLASAPSGVAQLRELILALAVRGKLVPQQDADGYASRLLEESRAQVRAKMQEGKAKKEKPAADVDAAETPFEIPDTWQWCRLTDTGEFINGLAFKPTDWAPDGLPIIRIQNLSGRNQEFNRTKGSFHPSVIVRSGDILVSWSATLDAFIWHGETGVLNQHIFRVEPAPCVDRGFLYWLLKWAIRDLAESEHAHGLVMSHINRGPFLAKPIALPPLAEQARIVARVDELMQLCDALEAKGRLEAQQHARLLETLLVTLTDSTTPEELAANWQRVAEHFDLLLDRPDAVDALEQTILQLSVRGLLVPQDEADEPARVVLERINSHRRRAQKQSPASPSESDPAEPPYVLPSQWAWARLGDLVENMGSGWSPACEDGERSDPARWAVLRTTSVQVMEYRAHEHKAIPLKLAPRPEIEVKPGDILVTRAGPMNRVGISCWVDRTPARLMLSDKIVRFHPVSDELCPAFVVLALNAGWTRELLEAAKTGMAASQVNVSQSDLKSLWVPVCSREEQDRIVARVTDLRHLFADLRQSLGCSSARLAAIAEALIDQALAT